MARYRDERLEQYEAKIGQAAEIANAAGVYDLANIDLLPFNVLKRVHQLFADSNYVPVKGGKYPPEQELAERLGPACRSLVVDGGQIVIVLEKGPQSGEQQQITIKGKTSGLYAAYFRVEKKLIQPKNK